ncbi:hypothetical protein EK904_003997 [Melospiza melodia maxima]|nr:hypothetical protein EK904_003997 [Melospiza melodia maxima]
MNENLLRLRRDAGWLSLLKGVKHKAQSSLQRIAPDCQCDFRKPPQFNSHDPNPSELVKQPPKLGSRD